ncbi:MULTISPECIES: sulfur carrier protein ThiS [unclassified Chelatococcus]|uniref:sulfur carrier protein ThiS n=1 Tax=unclassified Chelatococcus TaxID=2638111 RepID=UPI001BCC1308|nr:MULTISPECIES: sulfur carrier protein ThiS [unclassified Chelatococcus]CAH1672779.1 Sulfur carrier protein [Hyphomicrobiales bacterium]MBS7738633.1 sulfur carrier protein ThiS [Chelatococcus sp. HY11]MBX3543037.1 sulfur carrier protein ThiS [Chelatococcus sp.]MCO5076837.1 sulfur carrier protein ThiS [Chelatococcus sp.]CAH1674977.1 Sulfur carrier protein [Hyphomicrobiales bacterium]
MPELIRVNGEEAALEVATVAELVASHVAVEARGIAVALNGAVLPRAKWPETRLTAGDRVEIVRARQGG